MKKPFTNANAITITMEEFNTLTSKAEMLDCLEACGVDNWGGYGEAMDMYCGTNDEEE
jgi:hypothetical protein